jgi:hypothetical protein
MVSGYYKQRFARIIGGLVFLNSLGLVVRAGTAGDTVVDADGVAQVAGELDVVVGKLAELDVIHAELLLLGGGAEGQTGDEVEEEEDDAGEDKSPGEGSDGTGELVTHLDPVVLDPAKGIPLNTVKLGNPGTETHR